MNKFFLCLLSALSLLCACEKTSIRKTLEHAEILLREQPDSALSLLEGIRPDELRTREGHARHALLLSAALDKNYIDVDDDSLIRQATDYYTRHGGRKYRMLSLYYHGLVLKNAGDYTASIISLEKAGTDAEKLEGWHDLGLIERNKADIFCATNNNEAAITHQKRALRYFQQAGDSVYACFAKLGLAIDHANAGQYAEARQLLSGLRQQQGGSSILSSQCDLLEADILVEEKMSPGEAVRLFRQVPESLFSLQDLEYYALALDRTGQQSESDRLLSQAYARARDRADSATVGCIHAKITAARNGYKEAYRILDTATSIQDSLTRVLLRQSVSAAQRDYYRGETLLQEARLKALKERTVLGGIILLLLLCLLMAVLIARSARKDKELKEQMASLILRQQEIKRLNKEKAHLLGSLFSERLSHLDQLSEDYFKADTRRQKEMVFKQFKENVAAFKNNDDLFLALEQDLDHYCNGIMTKLRSQVPSIKKDHRKTIALFFAGLPYGTVKLILNKNSVESLKMARSRYRKAIKESGAEDTALFLSMLDMEKKADEGPSK